MRSLWLLNIPNQKQIIIRKGRTDGGWQQTARADGPRLVPMSFAGVWMEDESNQNERGREMESKRGDGPRQAPTRLSKIPLFFLPFFFFRRVATVS
jgi:hypothetical protein